MGEGGANDDKRSQFARGYERMRLKLYRKPKQGYPPDQAQGSGTSPFGDAAEKGKGAGSGSSIDGIRMPVSSRLVLIGAVIVLGAILVYVFYTPAPPALGTATDIPNLVPLCQQGNGTACALTALLRSEGKMRLDDDPGVPDKNAAFAYARIACGKKSPFGCFLLWHLWMRKDVPLIKSSDAEEAIRRGCEEKSPFCCHLLSRFSGRKEVSAGEWKDAVGAFRSGGVKRYAERDEEQRLFERFVEPL